MKSALAFLAALALSMNAAAEQRAGAKPPAWFLEEIAQLSADGGRWIADNSAYRSDQENYDAYGIEWRASFDGSSMSGRLFAMRDGKELGDFWEFRQYWHPDREEAILEQFGWGGAVGAGVIWREGEVTKVDQTFYAPGGPSRRTGHVGRFPDADTHDTESFTISGKKWTPDRRYVWRRVRMPE
jgi:hypothetical protein